MTKTRDEIVEIGMTAVFNKPVQSVREGLEAAIDHLITAGVITQWRPIEEAPRDGATVIFFTPNNLRVEMGRWFGGEAWQNSSGSACFTMPTHFMLLPTPPQEGGVDVV